MITMSKRLAFSETLDPKISRFKKAVLGATAGNRVSEAPLRFHPKQKKGQTFRSDLEEAATYSPTGKPQYHRRK